MHLRKSLFISFLMLSSPAYSDPRWTNGNIIYLPQNVSELNMHYQLLQKKYSAMDLEGIRLDLKIREDERLKYLATQDAKLKKYFEKNRSVLFFEKMSKAGILKYIEKREIKNEKKQNALPVSWMKYTPSESLLLPGNYLRKLIK
jgi:hypothetical protein